LNLAEPASRTEQSPFGHVAPTLVHAGEIVQGVFNHPADDDLEYQRRRRRVSEVALGHRDGEPVPPVEYTDAENGVWRTLLARANQCQARFACARYRDAWDLLSLDRERVPQLADVNAILGPRTGFRMSPVTGLVSPRSFFGQLARGVLLSPQYVRCAATPLFSPDPDVIHGLIGYAPALLDPAFAGLNRRFGRTALRVNEATRERIIRVHWFTLETGLAREDGRPKAYGAAILSSPQELKHSLGRATIRPFNLAAIGETPFEPTILQDQLFLAEGVDSMIARVSTWLDTL
jgi:phenylalanine-4-hydroxylase